MPKFKVEIVETYRRYVEVEAQDEDVAYQDIDDKINEGIIDLPCDGDNYKYDRELFVSEVKEIGSISYSKLFDILYKKNISLMELKDLINVSNATLAKFRKNEPVSLTVISKVCAIFKCQPSDIMKVVV